MTFQLVGDRDRQTGNQMACDARMLETTGQRAAAVLLSRSGEICRIWSRLCDDEPDRTVPSVTAELTERSVLAFATLLRGDNAGYEALNRQWLAIKPTRQVVAESTVAMSLFPEAIRQILPSIPDFPLPAEQTIAAARRFVRRATTDILHTIELEPGEARWEEIARELEEQRLQRVERLRVLTEITRVVNTSDDLDELFEQVHALCARVIPGDNFLISFYDATSTNLTPRLLYFKGQRRTDLEQQPRPAGLLRLVAEWQRPWAVADYLATCAQEGIEPDPLAISTTQPLHFMAAPMVQGGQTVGVIGCFSTRMPFLAEDLELLEAAARQTAVALEIRRLIKAERRRVRQLEAVNQLAREIVVRHDVDQLLETAAGLVHELFGYNLVGIFLREPSGDLLTLRASAPPAHLGAPDALRLPIGAGSIVGDVAERGQPVLVGDVSRDSRYLATEGTAGTRAELAVPIARDGRVLGVLDVQSPMADAFDRHDLTPLTTIADQIAVALQNAELIQDERERSRALALMLSTTRAAGSTLILDEVLERLAGGIVDASGAAACAIYLFDQASNSFAPAVAVGKWEPSMAPLQIEQSAWLQQVLTEGQPCVCCAREAIAGAEICGCADRSALLVPLLAKGQTLGMAVVIAGGDGHFYPENVRLLQGVADSAALAVENARLYARSQGLAIAQERSRLAQEIHDGLAQGLTAISLQLELADALLPAKAEKALGTVRRALELTRDNLEEARRSVLDLSAVRLNEQPLPEALRRLALRTAETSDLEIDFRAVGLHGRLSARVETGLYRIAEEAMENVCRHAGARHVWLELKAQEETVTLRIQDDGVGFDPSGCPAPGAESGFGLVGIRERARLLHGSLEIESGSGAGTRLVVRVPFEACRARQELEIET